MMIDNHPSESYMAKYQSMHEESYKNAKRDARGPNLTRIFLYHSKTTLFLEKGDLVLIVVPEEMEIHGFIDPQLHGRAGYLIGEDDGDVLVELKKPKRKRDLDSLWCITPRRDPKDIVSVPKFLLCLEERILNDRIAKDAQKKKKKKKQEVATEVKKERRYVAEVHTN